MNGILEWLLSPSAGNFGDFLSGVAILVLTAGYFIQKQQKNNSNFQDKVNRTFRYGKGFKKSYDSFIFLHFSKYLENILSRKPEESLQIITLNDGTLTGGAAVEKIRQEASTFYLFLQELMYILKKNKELDFIDESELEKIIKSYAVQTKDFFSVVDIMIADKRQTKGIDGWGSINEEDFSTLKAFFQSRYICLK